MSDTAVTAPESADAASRLEEGVLCNVVRIVMVHHETLQPHAMLHDELVEQAICVRRAGRVERHIGGHVLFRI